MALPIAVNSGGSTPSHVQLRVGREGRGGVTGNVDLRDHRDVPGGRVRDEVSVLLLGVEAARASADLRAAAVRGEPGPPADLQPPGLVVGEVQVQHVHLVPRDQVDEPAYLRDGEEVPHDVEHHAAVGIPGAVGDVSTREGPRTGAANTCLHGGREQLPQRLYPREQAGRAGGAQRDAGAFDVEPVAGRIVVTAVDGQGDRSGARVGHDGQREAGHRPQDAGEVLRDRSGLVDGDDGGRRADLEVGVWPGLRGNRCGNDGEHPGHRTTSFPRVAARTLPVTARAGQGGCVSARPRGSGVIVGTPATRSNASATGTSR